MLTEARLEHILARIPRLTIGVVGDLFLDKYLDLDAALTEPSLETGLDAYQVVGIRCYPGAAGTVLNNLAALGVGRIVPFTVIGDDGEGFELQRGLKKLANVNTAGVFVANDPGFHTPTYTKPMLSSSGGSRELNRMDTKNRRPMQATDALILPALSKTWPQLDALLVVDQVSEAECGVVTTAVRQRLGELANAGADRWIIADSRERIGLFSQVSLKPNVRECLQAAGGGQDVRAAATILAQRTARPVFCTRGDQGMLIAEPSGRFSEVPAFPVTGPTDPVGAGDSSSAALACALAAGGSLVESAAFANLVASITIQQLGVTGTATPAQVRGHFQSRDR